MGYTASRTIIACGIQSAAPLTSEAVPSRQANPLCGYFPRSDASGYWGDMTRTFLKGKAPKSVMRAYNAVKKASETAMSMIRAGVIAADVHIAASETMAGLGFQTGRGARRHAVRVHSRAGARRRA